MFVQLCDKDFGAAMLRGTLTLCARNSLATTEPNSGTLSAFADFFFSGIAANARRSR